MIKKYFGHNHFIHKRKKEIRDVYRGNIQNKGFLHRQDFGL